MNSKKFEILCVTMHQSDFSKINKMNIKSDVIFANQTDKTAYDEFIFDGEHTAKMISAQTKGVGINRNTALMYADAEICLFADDDVVYVDDLEEKIVREFDEHPDADIFIFNLTTDSKERPQKIYNETRRCTPWERMPWGGCRIAVRLSSIRRANVWFTAVFGGGCLYTSGEDSMWLIEAKRKGLRFYVSKEIIGQVSFATSTWFSGRDEKFFFGKGAYCAAVHQNCFSLWMVYYSLRYSKSAQISFRRRIKWMRLGRKGFINMKSYEDICKLSQNVMQKKD